MTNEEISNSNKNRKKDETVTKLHVKYMVCLRDKLTLKTVLNDQGLIYGISVHGAVEFPQGITTDQYNELKMSLSKSGLMLLDEKESMLIDRIIHTIIEVIHYSDTLPKVSFRDLISKHAISGRESILKIFSDVKGMSVLQFIVIQKIERVKELLLYDDMPLSKIAELLNYKNQDLLSAQFKKVTGLTPSDFKRIKRERMGIAGQSIHSSPSDSAGGSSDKSI
jgi:AraC-like DNA-binding protein